MARVKFGAFIATTEVLPSYGGIQIPLAGLQNLLRQLKSGPFPFGAHHDDRLSFHVELLSATIKKTKDGYDGLWVDLEADEEYFDQYPGLRGLSLSVTESLEVGSHPDTEPPVRLAADVGHFSVDQLRAAGSILRRVTDTRVDNLFQFSTDVPAKIVLEFSLALFNGVLSAAIYDALKLFLKKKEKRIPSIFSFRVEGTAGSIHGHLETQDTEVLRDAVDKLTELGSGALGYEFDPVSRSWRPRAE